MSICGTWSHWKLCPLELCMEELVTEQGSAVAPTTGVIIVDGAAIANMLQCCLVKTINDDATQVSLPYI